MFDWNNILHLSIFYNRMTPPHHYFYSFIYPPCNENKKQKKVEYIVSLCI